MSSYNRRSDQIVNQLQNGQTATMARGGVDIAKALIQTLLTRIEGLLGFSSTESVLSPELQIPQEWSRRSKDVPLPTYHHHNGNLIVSVQQLTSNASG